MTQKRLHFHCGSLLLRLLLLSNGLQLATQERPVASSSDDVQLAVGNRGTAVVQPLDYSKTSEGISAMQRSVNGVYQWAERNLDATADKSLEKSAAAGLHVQDFANGLTNYRNSVKTYRQRLRDLNNVEVTEVKDDMAGAKAEHIRNAMSKEALKRRTEKSKDDITLRDGPGKTKGGEPNYEEGDPVVVNGWREGAIMSGPDARARYLVKFPDGKRRMISEMHMTPEVEVKRHEAVDIGHLQHQDRDPCVVETYSDKISWKPWAKNTCDTMINRYIYEGDASKEFKFDKGSDDLKKPTFYKIRGQCHQVRFYDNDYFKFTRKDVDVFGTNNEKCTKFKSDLRRDLKAVKIWAMPQVDPCTVKLYRDDGCTNVANSYSPATDKLPEQFKFKPGRTDGTHYTVSDTCHRVRFFEKNFKSFRKDIDVHGEAGCTKLPLDKQHDLGGIKVWPKPRAPKDGKAGGPKAANSVFYIDPKLAREHGVGGNEAAQGEEIAAPYVDECDATGLCSTTIPCPSGFARLSVGPMNPNGENAFERCCETTHCVKDNEALGQAVEPCSVTTFSDKCVHKVKTYESSDANLPKEYKFKTGSDEEHKPEYFTVSAQCHKVEFLDNDFGPFAKSQTVHLEAGCTPFSGDLKHDLGGLKLWAKSQGEGTGKTTGGQKVHALATCQVETYRSKDCTDIINTYQSGNNNQIKKYAFGKGSKEKKAYWYKIEGDCGRVEFVDDHYKLWAKNMDVNGPQECTKFSFRLKNDLGGINIWPPLLQNHAGVSNVDHPTQVNPDCTASTYSDEHCSDEVKSYQSSEMVKEFKFTEGEDEEQKPTHYKLSGQCLKVEFYDAHAILYKSNHKAYDSQECTKLPWGLRHDLGGLKMWVKQQQGGWKDGAYGAHAFGGHPR